MISKADFDINLLNSFLGKNPPKDLIIIRTISRVIDCKSDYREFLAAISKDLGVTSSNVIARVFKGTATVCSKHSALNARIFERIEEGIEPTLALSGLKVISLIT